MKVNINKYQTGGPFSAIRPVFDYYSPLKGGGAGAAVPTPTRQTASSTEEDESDLLDDHIKNLLKNGGLTNDYKQIIKEIYELQNSDPYGMTSQNDIGSSLKTIGKINEVANNKKLWNDAYAEARANGSLNETAIGNSGEIFYRDKTGKVKVTDLNNVNRLKYTPLTVKELLHERMKNPNFAFNNSILEVPYNSVSMNDIVTKITDMTDRLDSGKQTTEKYHSRKELIQRRDAIAEELSYFWKEPSELVKKEFANINRLLETPGEYIKESKSSTQKNTKNAINFIWKTLSPAEQRKIKLNSVKQGFKTVNPYIANLLDNFAQNSTESELSTADPSKFKDKTSSGSSGLSDKPIGLMEINHSGKVGKKTVHMNDPSTNKDLILTATSVFKLTDSEGMPMGITTLNNIFNSEVGTLFSLDKATFGDKKITMNNTDEIIYDGNEGMRVYLPTKSDGSADLSKLEMVKNLESEIFANPSLTPAQINEMFEERGIGFIEVDNQKRYVINERFKPFYLMSAYTGEASDIVKANGRVKLLSSEEKRQVSNKLEAVWGENNIKAPLGWFKNDIYKAMVAMPYVEDSSVFVSSMENNVLAPQASIQQIKINKQKSSASRVNADPNFFNN